MNAKRKRVQSENSGENRSSRRKLLPAVGPKLRILLYVILALVAILGVNSAYLAGVTFLEWWRGETYQNYFYQYMFLGHLILGLLLVCPVIVFGFFHRRNARHRPQKRAIRVGYALLATSLALLLSGIVLMRVEGFEIRRSDVRGAVYWLHVLAMPAAIWLYVLHRLAGPKIRWRVGLYWASACGVIVLVMVWLHSQDPRQWNVAGPEEGQQYFEPSLARTASGNFIPEETLMMDSYCQECHPDVYDGWFHSAHRFSSFNNELYLFSIRETRRVLLERDGNVTASRWCAGCHDVVPFFSGAFDDPEYDMVNDPTAHAGITCTACHAITHVNSPRGNADYTIEEPLHYPFARSQNRILRFINRQLVKAKPEFHKKTFLKPLHRSAEFCSTCHKVSLPFELTHYKDWHRGQNHYDSFLLSGFSGSNAKSFYHPPVAEANCNSCHMPLKPSQDFGADFFAGSKERVIHDHFFPGGNSGVPALRGDEESVSKQREFLKDSLRIDLFGIREGGTIDGKLTAPLDLHRPRLEAGQSYLVEVVLRNLKTGHAFTQGTADSNQVWVSVEAKSGATTFGLSGGMDASGRVDAWAHFVNLYLLDREGNRIDRRNVQDIHVPLYDNQIPPGAADVLHYRLQLPPNLDQDVELTARLHYRKFDTTYLQHVFGPDYANRLPIIQIAEDRIVLPVGNTARAGSVGEKPVPLWERWNDYGIGLFLGGGDKGQLRQAEYAFSVVEELGRPDGPLNLARIYLQEGRIAEAGETLRRVAAFDPPAPRWTTAWLNALVNRQNGLFDQSIQDFRSILEDRYEEVIRRGFDFSRDYQVLNELGLTYYGKSTTLRTQPQAYRETLELAVETFEKTLKLDPENETAHYNLGVIQAILGNEKQAEHHRERHKRYRSDDNAQDRAIVLARERDPAGRQAAQPVVIYDLHREERPAGNSDFR